MTFLGIINAVGHNAGINKFYFKVLLEQEKQSPQSRWQRILERELFMVDFDSLIDSKLGQTSKNITSLFDEISTVSNPNKVIVLFDGNRRYCY